MKGVHFNDITEAAPAAPIHVLTDCESWTSEEDEQRHTFLLPGSTAYTQDECLTTQGEGEAHDQLPAPVRNRSQSYSKHLQQTVKAFYADEFNHLSGHPRRIVVSLAVTIIVCLFQLVPCEEAVLTKIN
jgi:hypothetical protein